jgi:short-subunit dehydrogenase
MKIEELFCVRDKIVLITGGSRRLGEMMARAYVGNGAKVYISARNAQVCGDWAKELSTISECVGIPADLSNRSASGRIKQARKSA